MNAITLTVNGEQVSGIVEPRTHLADFLRGGLGLTGTHLGCEQGVCGACTVMIDGRPSRSCLTLAASCEGADVRTVEGFDDDPAMAAIRDAFCENHGLQCGFCTPGMLITARDIVGRLGEADEKRVRHELAGNICRCTGYQGIVNAITGVIAKNGRMPFNPETPAIELKPAMSRPTPPAFTRKASTQTAAPAAPQVGMAVDEAGWTVVTQSFTVPHPADEVWTAFGDIPSVARCMPGAEITEVTGNRVEGRLTIRFGPISASFGGEATHTVDAAARTGALAGRGNDSGSATSAQGAMTYAVVTEDAETTRVDISVRFKLSGPLAQFSRGGLVRDFVARLTDTFSKNLSAMLSGKDITAGDAGLNAFALLWSVIRRRLAALFGGQSAS